MIFWEVSMANVEVDYPVSIHVPGVTDCIPTLCTNKQMRINHYVSFHLFVRHNLESLLMFYFVKRK